MPRLPQPGSDDGTWGDILNTYLSVEHNPNGSQKPLPQSTIIDLEDDLAAKADSTELDSKAPINSPTFTGSVTLPGNPTSSLQAATKDYVDTAAGSAVTSVDGQTGDVDLDEVYVRPPLVAEKRIYVSPQGDDANDGRAMGSNFAVKTLARALQLMGTTARGVIEMGYGNIDAGTGCSLSGYRCGLVGQSAIGTKLTVTGVQSGPALNLTGWVQPGFEYIQEFGNFTIVGDNTAGITKEGMKFGSDADGVAGLAGIYAHDITVEKTGGACFNFGHIELCTLVNLVAVQPVNCYENDVPYFKGTEACNGNSFSRCGLRSSTPATTIAVGSNGQSLPQSTINVASSASYPTSGTTYVSTSAGLQLVTYTGKTATTLTGCSGGTGTMATGDTVIARPDCASGCVRFFDGTTYSVDQNLFDAWWFEYQHLPSGGTLFDMQGCNDNALRNFQYFDLSKITRASGTSHIRIRPPGAGGVAANFGGNHITGVIPGKGTAAINIDMGIDVQQSGNSMVGVKGYYDTQVVIASGVARTFVMLGGTQSGATGVAVTDNSGTTSNVVIDASNGFQLTAGTLRGGAAVMSGVLQLTKTNSPVIQIGAEGGFAALRIDQVGSLFWGSGSATQDISLGRVGANRMSVGSADLEITTLGRGLKVKEGANGRAGVATLAAGTVTIANTSVTANTRIYVQRQTDGGTVGASYSITRVSGTSFTITAKDGLGATQSADTSTVAWLMLESL
jgi:hypothetical protein